MDTCARRWSELVISVQPIGLPPALVKEQQLALKTVEIHSRLQTSAELSNQLTFCSGRLSLFFLFLFCHMNGGSVFWFPHTTDKLVSAQSQLRRR